MSRADTGESTAVIRRRTDDRGFEQVLPMLANGRRLLRSSLTRRWYVDGWGSISDAGIKRLVDEGKLVRVMNGYVLAEGAR